MHESGQSVDDPTCEQSGPSDASLEPVALAVKEPIGLSSEPLNQGDRATDRTQVWGVAKTHGEADTGDQAEQVGGSPGWVRATGAVTSSLDEGRRDGDHAVDDHDFATDRGDELPGPRHGV